MLCSDSCNAYVDMLLGLTLVELMHTIFGNLLHALIDSLSLDIDEVSGCSIHRPDSC